MIVTKLGNKNTEYIAAIAEFQNITKAAEALYISQPALSKFLLNLENTLQVKLFNRYNGKYQPTFEGERFLFYAKQINILNNQLEIELRNIIDKEHGRLRVSVPSQRSSNILPKILPEFCNKYPYVKVDIIEGDSSSQKTVLLSGAVDVAILIDRIKHPNIQTIKTGQEDMLLVVPNKHPLFANGNTNPNKQSPLINIKAVADDNFILPTDGQHTRIVANRIFNENNIKPNIRFCTRSIENMLQLSCHNLGICMVSTTYAKHYKTEKPLAFYRIDSKHAYSNLLIAYIKSAYRPKYIKDFIDLFKAYKI